MTDESPLGLERAFSVKECPRCDGSGQIQTYNPARFDGIWAHTPAAVEVPCLTCGARMDADDNSCEWVCPICGDTRGHSPGWHVERLTDDAYPEGSGKPGVHMGECPVCGDGSSVNGTPDGDLECDECGEFFAAQFTSEWYAYSNWETDNGWAVVNPREVRS